MTHSAQWSLATPLGSTRTCTSPTPFKQWVCGGGLFTSHKIEPGKWKCCEKGPTVFLPYLRKLEKVQPFADVITKAALSSQLFKDPECWSGWGLHLRTPTKQTSTFPAELTRQGYNQVAWSQVIQRGGTYLYWNIKSTFCIAKYTRVSKLLQ